LNIESIFLRILNDTFEMMFTYPNIHSLIYDQWIEIHSKITSFFRSHSVFRTFSIPPSPSKDYVPRPCQFRITQLLTKRALDSVSLALLLIVRPWIPRNLFPSISWCPWGSLSGLEHGLTAHSCSVVCTVLQKSSHSSCAYISYD
jgi:hypothetical protein